MNAPIKRNNFNIFGNIVKKHQNASKKQLKKDLVLFSNLFIICQTRQLDLNEFFKYENQPFPPSISNEGELYSTKKSDIIPILEEKVETLCLKPQSDALIVDGSWLVYSFAHQRVGFVFDQYKAESLKSYTRQQRGEGVRRKVTPTGKLPKDWGSFLRNNSNKMELFTL